MDAQQGSQKSIVVIGVNYQTDAKAIEFLRSIRSASGHLGARVTTILVDNSDRSNSSDFFVQAHTVHRDVICLKTDVNRGYFGGARAGLEEYRKLSRSEPDWVIVSNVDIRVKGPEFFSSLIDLDSTDHIGVVAPTIWSKRRQQNLNPDLNSRPTRLRMLLYRTIFSKYYLRLFFTGLSETKFRIEILVDRILEYWRSLLHFAPRTPESAKEDIYSAHGACMAFSKRYFKEGGTLEFPCFLYSEEIFVAETALGLHLRVVYVPSMKVDHIDDKRNGRFWSRKDAQFSAESTAMMVERFFSKST